ncbi:4,5-DOPA-extradiol-dioxygenase [Pedobacter nutrimenti]|jgi:4,5-DOPA dioxygenase extradiol|uniref:4,5-DOPA dioxygenase extradiol n=1 Tax=Pedobacter nutrimenti TaxID=1241337 RepID=A0A318UH78_9SPHI|nr:4,5-DOPA dioxygenase extradiol [Pedobacter nutrimenti]PYF75764.1 4,5-DOPA dioxygenase extradiol [Pedobacter nutrimenti]
MANLSDLKRIADTLPEQERLMPVLFIGHGSPMNGIEDNEFSLKWAEMAKNIPQPKAVLVISAHWFTRGTLITAMDFPPTIHDFGGFPQALFDVEYPAPGDPKLAVDVAAIVKGTEIGLDHDWGLDHGAWTVVRHMYPDARIPVLQLSMDYTKQARYHYELAAELYALRKKGVLILGSGNMVHNLRMMSWEMIGGGGYDWALDINDKFKSLILHDDHQSLIAYQTLGKEAMLAIPTPEHYLPLLYTLGLKKGTEEVLLFNDKAVGGSLTMTSIRIG